MENMESAPAQPQPKPHTQPPPQDEILLKLCKYLLLLASVVATVTYAAGFNPPGGVWQDTDAAADHLAGDPIIRATHYGRYVVFFYCNAAAFASSLVVTVLLLAVLSEEVNAGHIFLPLRLVMVVDLVSLMAAYAAGACRDTITAIYSWLLVAGVFAYLVVQRIGSCSDSDSDKASPPEKLVLPDRKVQMLRQRIGSCPDSDKATLPEKQVLRDRKVQMLLATFTVSVTYMAGLSTPGGFWDSADGGHHPGEAILRDHQNGRLTAFFICNTTAFAASLLVIVVLLLDTKFVVQKIYACVAVALLGLFGAYAAGSCRNADTTLKVAGLFLACAVFQMALFWFFPFCQEMAAIMGFATANTPILHKMQATYSASRDSVSDWVRVINESEGAQTSDDREALEKARSLVLLLATLAATIAYQAGLDPPGGLWQDNSGGHTAGDPILLTTNARRYKAFFFCNSVAFVASLVAIVFVHTNLLLQHQVLELAMVLDLFGLIGAYAAGSSREVSTSIYVLALSGAVMVYVVIHVIFLTLELDSNNEHYNGDKKLVENRRKRLLLFAILAATITYQSGLTPPGGFRLRDDESGHQAGDPVLLYNYPRRYWAFFYCNSLSFMLSIALIILLVNPHVYRPAIRSHALSLCSVVGLLGLMGAYAAGGTQHLKTSIYIFLLIAAVIVSVAVLLLGYLDGASHGPPAAKPEPEPEPEPEETRGGGRRNNNDAIGKRKYLMLLAILVASVTYQAGLDPPGGVWQSSTSGHEAGYPVMHGNRRNRYLVFFYCNSTSFVASIVAIVFLLLPTSMQEDKQWLRAMNTTLVLDLLGLLGAYAAGSSRRWKTSAYVVALVVAVLGYIALHVMLALHVRRKRLRNGGSNIGHHVEAAV